jgi:hypothetical protein
MSMLDHVVDILRKGGAFSGRLPASVKGKTDLADIFRELLPDKTLAIDPDVIDELSVYGDLLDRIASATGGEFLPENIKVSPGRGDRCVVQFSERGINRKLNFSHASGSYLDVSFLEGVQKYCAKNLSGSFVWFSGSELIDLVYLPKKAFRRFEREITSKSSPDVLADLILTSSVHSIGWEGIPIEVINGYTKEGETIVTSLIKASFAEVPGEYGCTRREYALGAISGWGPNFHLQNAHGETPIQLARERGWEHLIPDLSVLKTKPITYDDLLQRRALKWISLYKFGLETAFERLGHRLEGMYFDANLCSREFHMSRHSDFVRGEDALYIYERHRSGAPVCFYAFSQKTGSGGWSISKEVSLDAVDELCDLINGYCDGVFN